MKSCICSAFSILLSMGVIVLTGIAPTLAATADGQDLDAETIAQRSLSVAESMRTSGYCYAGVSKALSPLGVSLTGEAAFQAREQLLADSRFMAVSMDDSGDLRRGDIVVFNKSASRPYGHICVYQGNGEETSDHVSQLTTPGAYGGVTVFRLRSDNNDIAGNGEWGEWTYKMPVAAPDFRSSNSFSNNAVPVRRDSVVASASRYGRGDTKSGSSKPGSSKSSFAKPGSFKSGSSKSGYAKPVNGESGALELVRREFRTLNSSAAGKSLTKRLLRFVMNNL